MKIGLVTDFYYPWIGGPSGVVKNLGQGLAARGHSVSVLAPSPDGPSSVQLEEGLEVTRVRTVPAPVGYNLRTTIVPRREVSDWLDDRQPDVVHIHHPFSLSATALFLARKKGIRVVGTNHTIPECSLWGIRNIKPVYRAADAGFSWWLLQVLNRCDKVATPTRTAATALHNLGFTREVVPISNGIDAHRFSPGNPTSNLREQLGLDERPVILYTGRLDAEKQMDVWLRAAAELLQSCDVQLLVGGQGADRERLEGLAKELGLQNRVIFFGYLPEDQLPDVYRIADVYFIASPVELQSITGLEAIASGLPMVGVRAGALPELIEHGNNGYLVEPGDWKAAAQALRQILDDSGQIEKMGMRSREMALEHDLRLSIDKYDEFLSASANGHASPSA